MEDEHKRRVLVLDDDRDYCDLVGDLLRSFAGAECVVVHSLRELITRRDEALACDLAILDVNLGPQEPTGIDGLTWLREHAFAGRVVFLTGHARRLAFLDREAEMASVLVLEKPVDPGRLVSLATAAS